MPRGRPTAVRVSVVLAALAGPAAAGCTPTDAVRLPAPSPEPRAAAGCRELIAALPDDLAPGRHRRRTDPRSPYTAAFGRPAVTVRCGAAVPAHDPLALVEQVDQVDWLQLSPSAGAERYVSYHSRLVVQVVVPHTYLPADVLLALSPLVTRFGAGPATAG